ncbi:MAG TPA: LuxR C-terminal-related transcriptional regulator [Candidatus Dormibacteraeota bacterium]|nr:LuxR C-terminal-related transcriptional regulator [Candidatus Dormibacteraeota bacterium]
MTRLLDETTARVILLVAPAGYGKTTVARQWVRQRTHAWVRATSASADVAALAADISASIASVLGEPSPAIANWLKVTPNPAESLEALATLQLEDLIRWPNDAWLVLDEYEWLTESPTCEEYVRLLVEGSALRMLVTSRRKPTWATARRHVYGDFSLVDRRLLKMTNEEARCVLSLGDAVDSNSVVRAAAGWPAVIGLAVARSTADLSHVVPEALYEFLAEELFFRSSAELRATLPKLALAPDVGPRVATTVAGSAATVLLEEAMAAGYFTGSPDCPSFHPLLKSFLLSKLDRDDPDVTLATRGLVALYIEEEAWDSAFHVLQNRMDAEALEQLISAGREPLLRLGRTATLTDWLAAASDEGLLSPATELLKAELAARDGRAIHAERLALYVANSEKSDFRFEALCIAGRAAHLDNRDAGALAYFREAEAVATSEDARHEARWGALVCANALHDKDELARALSEFLEYAPPSADGVVRAANARLYASGVLGDLDSALDDGLAVIDLAEECDPLVASSFLNALSRLLSLGARYEDSLDAADRALSHAERVGLTFVRPHGLLARAVALLGLEAYRGADEALDEANELATAIRDRHNIVDVRVVRAKLALCSGEIDDALRITEEVPRGVTTGLSAELSATRALALACAREIQEAHNLIAALPLLAFLPDAAALALATRAVMAAHSRDHTSLLALLEEIKHLGAVDGLVIAQRASPELLRALSRDPEDPELRSLLKTRASPDARVRGPLGSLTPRQRDVLALLRMGLTNREIASRLVIEEATAKVHVRHILRKLGVRSRTEAAVLATRLAREGLEPTDRDAPTDT